MYVLLIGLRKEHPPYFAGVFEDRDAARAAAEDAYQQVYGRPAQWFNKTQIAHDPDNWNTYAFAVVEKFELNAVDSGILYLIEDARKERMRGVID